MSRAVGFSLETLNPRAHVATVSAQVATAGAHVIAHASDSLRTTRKALSVGGKIAGHLATSSLKTLLAPDDDSQLRTAIKDTNLICQRGLETLDVEVEVIGRNDHLMQTKTFLIVGNHMSYLDILVFASVQPAVFVTSVDMGQVPLLGHLCRSGGSIFVERRHRERMSEDRDTLTETLKRGHHVLIYPEGTSTNGLEVKPFKKGLLTSAQQAGVDILPVVTSYVSVDGDPFDASTCDRIAWHGEMSFAPHLWQLMKLKKVKAKLQFLEPIRITPEMSRDEIAEASRAAIAKAYLPQG